MPVKIGNEIVTQQIVQEGPISFVESTTLSRIFDEDLNRCLLLATDETPEQTQRIIQHVAKQRTTGREDVDHIRLVHHAVQRMLAAQQAAVTIPFAERLAERFPSGRPEARRAFGHVLTAIEAITLLHCLQRQRNGSGELVAEPRDYHLARLMLDKPMGRLLGGGVSEAARRFAARLATWVSGPFKSTETYTREQFTDRSVRGWLSELVEVGHLRIVEAGRGKPTTYQITDIEVRDASALPTVQQVFDSEIPISTFPPGGKP